MGTNMYAQHVEGFGPTDNTIHNTSFDVVDPSYNYDTQPTS